MAVTSAETGLATCRGPGPDVKISGTGRSLGELSGWGKAAAQEAWQVPRW